MLHSQANKGWLPLAIAFLLCSAAFFQVANSVGRIEADSTDLWHHYTYLAEGFRQGHTYLSLPPPPGLLSLRDPYDPSANRPWRLLDASLYRGHFYLYFGPTPAVLLLLPWRLLTGGDLPQRLGVAAFAVLGLAALALLIRTVARSHFPRLSSRAVAGVFLVAAHAAWLPVILRRPAFWELPITAGACLLWWSLYFLWRFHADAPRRRLAWACATGAALALVLGCRVTFAPAAVLITALLFVRRPAGERGCPGIWGAGLVAAGIAALLAYNEARFGRLLEFGQSYQLWASDERTIRHLNPAFIPFNARLYLLSIPQLSPYFPFVRGNWPVRLPAGYLFAGGVHGILFALPVHLAGIGAAVWVLRSPPRAEASSRACLRILCAAAAAATLCASAIFLCWAGACTRYLVEWLAGWTVLSSVGLLAVLSDPRRWVRLAAVCASAWTVGYAWLASADFDGIMRSADPGTYRTAARLADWPSDAWIEKAGLPFGPVELGIRVPATTRPGIYVLMDNGRGPLDNQLLLQVRTDGRVQLGLAIGAAESVVSHVTCVTPPLAPSGGRLTARVEAPWLYPPPEHPYWRRLSDAAARTDAQTLYSITCDGRTTRVRSAYASDAVDFEPAVAGERTDGPAAPWVETLEPWTPTPARSGAQPPPAR